MVRIQLTTNDNMAIKGEFVVSERRLKHMETLQYIGGFKRFSLDVVGIELKQASEVNDIVNWLSTYVFPTDNKRMIRRFVMRGSLA